MSKSKNVTVSKKQLTETGEELEVVGNRRRSGRRGRGGRRRWRIWKSRKVAGRIAVQQTSPRRPAI